MEKLNLLLQEIKDSSSIEELQYNIKSFISYGNENYGLDKTLDVMIEKISTITSYMEYLIDQEGEKEVYKVFEDAFAELLINSSDLANDTNIILTKTSVFLDGTTSNVNILKNLPNDKREFLYQNICDEENRDINYNSIKESILISLNDDQKKIEYINEIYSQTQTFDDVYMLVTILKSFNEDKNKIDMMNVLSSLDYIDRLQIIKSLSDDKLKIQILQDIRDDKNALGITSEIMEMEPEFITEVLETVEDDALAISYLKESGLYEFDNIKNIAKSQKTIENIIEENNLTEEEKIKLIANNEDTKEVSRLLREKTNIEDELLDIDSVPSARLGLPENLTFGIELEAEGLMAEKTKRVFDFIKEINSSIKDWIVKKDGSLEEGTEIVSPILTDSKEKLHQLEYVSKMMQKIGFQETDTCGGHIHFGAEFLDIGDGQGPEKALKNLRMIWKEGEELFYKMSNGEGKVTRSSASMYASGIADILDDENEVMERLQESRRRGVNFCNLKPGGKNTIEFRLSNGTIDSEEIKQNIYLFGKLMVVSKDMAMYPEKYEEKTIALRNRDLSEAEKEEALLDILFENESEKEIYRRRWNAVKEEETYDSFAPKTLTFRRGDFSIRDVAKSFLNEVKLEDMQEFTNNVKNTLIVTINNRRYDAREAQ